MDELLRLRIENLLKKNIKKEFKNNKIYYYIHCDKKKISSKNIEKVLNYATNLKINKIKNITKLINTRFVIYKDDYIVFENGLVYSIISNKMLNPFIANGYTYIEPHSERTLLHRILALCFIPNPNNYNCVDHINNNKLDNTINNLRWVSREENTQLAFLHRKQSKK